jgi:hypothetical protein
MKHLLSEEVIATLGEPAQHVTIEVDMDTGVETQTTTVNGQVTNVNTTQDPNWGGHVVSGSGYMTTQVPGSFIPEETNADDLAPLLELIGRCVACGDEAELLLCTSCGVGVRELGRSKLREVMKEIEDELS